MRPTITERTEHSTSGTYPDEHTAIRAVLVLLALVTLGWGATALLTIANEPSERPSRSTVSVEPISSGERI